MADDATDAKKPTTSADVFRWAADRFTLIALGLDLVGDPGYRDARNDLNDAFGPVPDAD